MTRLDVMAAVLAARPSLGEPIYQVGAGGFSIPFKVERLTEGARSRIWHQKAEEIGATLFSLLIAHLDDPEDTEAILAASPEEILAATPLGVALQVPDR